MMKKTLSMVLALVMLMSTISCIGVTASAAADGIKFFNIEFLIDDELVADKKLTIDYAGEKSYYQQCEECLFTEGNVLTMYTTEDTKVVYKCDENGVFVETSGADGDILAMIMDFLGLNGDGRKLYNGDIFVGDVNISGESDDHFTVKLTSGLTTEVYVNLVGYPENFPVAINYIPATDITVIENCCGYFSGSRFIYDDIPLNQLGDRVVLDYIGKPDVEYVFEGDAYYNVAGDDTLPGEMFVDVDSTVALQRNKAWTTSSNNNIAVIGYNEGDQSVYGVVPVTVVKSEVKSITYVEKTALTVYENSCGEWEDSFVYNLEHFKKVAGNQIIVQTVDNAKVTYTSDKNGVFKSSTGAELDANHLYWTDTQAVSPWSIGTNNITIAYCGAKTQVGVDVIENPVDYVEYNAPNLLKVKEGVDGEWYVNNDGDDEFYYDCSNAIFAKDSTFTVYYKDGTSSVYTYVSGKTFKNTKGEALDMAHVKVTAYSQDSKAWEINNVYDFQITYLGVTCDVPVKAVPATVPATPKTKAENVENGIKVTWNTLLEAESYNLYRRAEGENNWTFLANLEGSEYVDKNVKNTKYYRYTVRAKNDNGLSKVDSTGALIKCVATPVMKKIVNATTGIYVEWSKISGADYYRVYRRGEGQTTWKYMGQTKNLWWVDKGIVNANGNYYRYTVKAVSKTSVETYSGCQTGIYIKRLANPLVKSAAYTGTGVEVNWKMISGAAGYYVYRKAPKAAESEWVRVGTVEGAKNTSFVDTTAAKNGAYQYTVRAFSGKTLSSYSSGVIYGVPEMPVLKTIANTTNGVKITWAKASRATSYRVYRRFAGGSWSFLCQTTDTTYLDKTAINGEYVAYTVIGVNDVGFSKYDSKGLLTKYVATPALKSATYDARTRAVTVKWGAVAGATEYHIYRRVAGGSWELIDATYTNYFVDNEVKANSYYVYTVRAVNGWRSSYESGVAVNTVANVDKF